MDLKNSLYILATMIVVANANLQDKVPIDFANRFYLGWCVDSTNAEITFEAEVETRGYVGLGISPSRTMAGADMFIGGVRNSETYSGDYYGTHNGPPVEDAHSDWNLISAVQNNTHTIVKFSRKIDTGDSEDQPIRDGTNILIWAIGPTDGLIRHSYRGVYSASISLPGGICETVNPPTRAPPTGAPPTGSPPTGNTPTGNTPTRSTGTPLPSTTKGTGSHAVISQLITLIALGVLFLK